MGKSRSHTKFCFGQVKTEMPVGHLSQNIFMCKAQGMQGELRTCCCSVTKSCQNLWIPRTAACQASLSPPSPRICSSSCLLSWWCYITISSSVTLFSFCCQSFPAWGFFSKESALRIRWLKYWSFSSSISSSNEQSGLISPKSDWFDLLAVQGPALT